MNKLFILLLVTPFILLMGCQTNRPHKSKEIIIKKFPPVLPEDVVVLRSSKPTWQYEEIGIITDFYSNENINYIFKEMQKVAGGFGANGIINFDITTNINSYMTIQTGINGSSFGSGSSISYRATGMMIRKTGENK